MKCVIRCALFNKWSPWKVQQISLTQRRTQNVCRLQGRCSNYRLYLRMCCLPNSIATFFFFFLGWGRNLPIIAASPLPITLSFFFGLMSVATGKKRRKKTSWGREEAEKTQFKPRTLGNADQIRIKILLPHCLIQYARSRDRPKTRARPNSQRIIIQQPERLVVQCGPVGA